MKKRNEQFLLRNPLQTIYQNALTKENAVAEVGSEVGVRQARGEADARAEWPCERDARFERQVVMHFLFHFFSVVIGDDAEQRIVVPVGVAWPQSCCFVVADVAVAERAAFGKMLKRPHFVTIGSGANRADGGVLGASSARFFVSMGWNFVSKGRFFVSKGWNFVSKGGFGAEMALKK